MAGVSHSQQWRNRLKARAMIPAKEKAASPGRGEAARQTTCGANAITNPAQPVFAVEARFLDFMRAVGLSPLKTSPVADGKLHRYRVEGDKSGSQNGWYALHLDPIPHGAVGSWRTGETHPWRDAEARPINWQERQDLQRRMRRVRERRYQEQQNIYREARAKAAKLWGLSRPADPEHPYLLRKRVKAWGIRQLRDQLLIPVRRDGLMHSLQLIGPDGSKRFLTGGKVGGGYFAIGKPAGVICVAEGYATAATVYEATGHATAVAFNANNLSPVALKLWSGHADTKIILIADDDHATPGNPGMTEAIRAAEAVGGWIARPIFSEARAA